ncbi:class I adenylate-forming enzyme family protein [Streptomyces sp. NBC_00280]|uniref:class I adenylate-forming enzyme family protein n=1 Tax=Streptomyces sp. NBC_00280 TaxID=2975699 RepID=UPI003251A25B
MESGTPLVADRFFEAAAEWPDVTCVSQVDHEGRVVRRVTYGELARSVRGRAGELRDAGIGPGACVGVPVRNDTGSVVDLLAVAAAGAAAVVVDANEPVLRRNEQLDEFCTHVLHDRRAHVHRPQKHLTDDDFGRTALAVFTTGSTAASRAVAQSHSAVTANVLATAAHHRMAPGEVMACALPISHVNGLHFGLLAPLYTGGSCLLFEKFEPLTYLGVLRRERATRATTVPSLLQALLGRKRWPELPDLRYFVSAAAALPRQTASAVVERSGRPVVQGYGLSECMNFATTLPVDLPEDVYRKWFLAADVLPVGHAVAGCEVSVRTTEGTDAPLGAVGEVCVRGASLMTGYLNAPEATGQAVRDGWLHTGDLGRLDAGPDGSPPWLTLLGRKKNIAKCGGLAVSLEEIDRWLLTLPGVLEACCVSRPDPQRGEAVTAFYVPSADAPGHDEISRHVERLFSTAALGLRPTAVTALPKLRSGKFDRRALSAEAAAHHDVNQQGTEQSR